MPDIPVTRIFAIGRDYRPAPVSVGFMPPMLGDPPASGYGSVSPVTEPVVDPVRRVGMARDRDRQAEPDAAAGSGLPTCVEDQVQDILRRSEVGIAVRIEVGLDPDATVGGNVFHQLDHHSPEIVGTSRGAW